MDTKEYYLVIYDNEGDVELRIVVNPTTLDLQKLSVNPNVYHVVNIEAIASCIHYIDISDIPTSSFLTQEE